MPWSMTPLKFIFHRSLPAKGNGNTAAVSRYNLMKFMEQKKFPSTGVAQFKMIVALGETVQKGEQYWMIDTGVSGNVFSSHYFDLSADFQVGKLRKMLLGP